MGSKTPARTSPRASNAKPKRGERSLAELLNLYPPSIRTLARQARTLILDVLPEAEEAVDGTGPYVGYGNGPGYKGLVASIIVRKTGVRIGLGQGARLPDPTGLLAGVGKVHRHIAVSRTADLARTDVHALVEAALVDWKRRQASTS